MIGYYIHHQGHGHLHRALTVARALTRPVDGLSTHARPDGWTGGWLSLADDAGAPAQPSTVANGWLHYAPTSHAGYGERMRQLASWIAAARPSTLMVDVSVEVALLARLHGVPVVTMAGPGRRDDVTHRLGYGVSDLVVAPWPEAAADLLRTGPDAPGEVVHVGAISRFAPQTEPEPVRGGQVLVMNGSGGSDVTGALVARAAAENPGWTWEYLAPGRWVSDPWPLLCASEVVVSHCGQNAVAEIAAARRPAILIPQQRPFDEQRQMARVLRELQMPVLVLDVWPEPGDWDRLLKEAAELDTTRWALWNDGRGADRTARLLEGFGRAGLDAA